MKNYKIAKLDSTFNDSYTENFKIDEKQEHIQEWFDYYCDSANIEPEAQLQYDIKSFSEYDIKQDSELGLLLSNNFAQVSSSQVRGNGPNGVFPGNFDNWTEKEDLYSQLFYEISQTWFYCEHRSLKGFYTMEREENQEAMDAIWKEYSEQKKNWREMFKIQIDPRRIWLGKFIRFNIHQNEFAQWAL